ncbi:DUF4262 domain-containing protein [Luteimonas panaciterrae]|uniref:DUF4262 domain-containing protein n=1 Tax=Luteimonas panaciterrae TaxID=363885 RepID=UPI001CFB3D6A|nr:DUF4262 domain-containing protein [Luteimonas panaciterrae]
MTRIESIQQLRQTVLRNIKTYGWHCNHVFADQEQSGFSYTIGLYESYGHPEMIIFGLPHTITHPILIDIADAAKSGRPFDLSKPTDALIVDYSCCFAEVSADRYEEHATAARWYYRDKPFPAYQIIWPSREGLFPWHPSATGQFRAVQPVIALHSAA